MNGKAHKSEILHGDCLEIMKTLEENSVDSIVTDPPYELGFMGKSWDNTGIANSIELWSECLRILKPGGYLLSFGGTRTYHRMACAIEDAGFEIRDMIEYVYGSGFPKSLNIGKAVDKLEGNERKIVGKYKVPDIKGDAYGTMWEGWGTALKPAHEPIVMARKPLGEKTVAENVLKWGTGGLNIDASRIKGEAVPINKLEKWSGFRQEKRPEYEQEMNNQGRFPANLIHDGSEEVVRLFPNTKSNGSPDRFLKTKGFSSKNIYAQDKWTQEHSKGVVATSPCDEGSAARFFYCAKASKSERDMGCDDLDEKQTTGGGGGIGDYLDDVNAMSGKYGSEKAPARNHHPTVKPLALMRYLIKLSTAPGGTVLDPFAGSGSTLVAAKQLGYNYIGIEKEADYIEIAKKRLTTPIQSSML